MWPKDHSYSGLGESYHNEGIYNGLSAKNKNIYTGHVIWIWTLNRKYILPFLVRDLTWIARTSESWRKFLTAASVDTLKLAPKLPPN